MEPKTDYEKLIAEYSKFYENAYIMEEPIPNNSVKTVKWRLDAKTGEWIGIYELDEKQRDFLLERLRPEIMWELTDGLQYTEFVRLQQIVNDNYYRHVDLDLLNKLRKLYIKQITKK